MPLSKFTPEELTQLKATFAQLPTISDKYNFWPTNLGYNYHYVGAGVDKNKVVDFVIYPKTSEENVELNLLVLYNAKLFFRLFHKVTREKLFEFEQEKAELDNKLIEVVNPIALLKKEKKWIKEQVAIREANLKITNKDLFDFKLMDEETACRFWYGGYEDYYLWGREPDLTRGCYDAPNLIAWTNGFEVALYLEYIEKRIEEISQKKTNITQEETSLKRQLLLLYYTGYIKQLEEGVKTDKERNRLLALLLNRSEQNIKKILTYINHPANLYDIKTKENLTFVLESLEKAGLNEEAQKVKTELEALK